MADMMSIERANNGYVIIMRERNYHNVYVAGSAQSLLQIVQQLAPSLSSQQFVEAEAAPSPDQGPEEEHKEL